MIVNVKPVTRKVNWGIPDKKDPTKYQYKYPRSKDKWCVGVSTKTGVLNTGLSEEEERYYEEKLQLPKGTLSRDSIYWKSYFFIIEAEGSSLDTSKYEDELTYKLLQADPFVAASPEEANNSARCQYYLTSKERDAKVRNVKRDMRLKAASVYSKMTEADIIDTLYMMGKDPSDTDSEVLRDTLGSLVEEQPAAFLAAYSDGKFKEKVELMKWIREGVVMKKGMNKGFNAPMYFEDIYLGTGLDESVKFLHDKENDSILKGVRQLYKTKIKQ